MDNKIGLRIKKAREMRGMTQEELGIAVNYKNKYAICKIEQGVNKVSSEKLAEFADALRVSILYLLGREELPEERAEFDAMVLMDDVLRESLKKYYTLSRDDQALIRDMIDRLAPKD